MHILNELTSVAENITFISTAIVWQTNIECEGKLLRVLISQWQKIVLQIYKIHTISTIRESWETWSKVQMSDPQFCSRNVQIQNVISSQIWVL